MKLKFKKTKQKKTFPAFPQENILNSQTFPTREALHYLPSWRYTESLANYPNLYEYVGNTHTYTRGRSTGLAQDP